METYVYFYFFFARQSKIQKTSVQTNTVLGLATFNALPDIQMKVTRALSLSLLSLTAVGVSAYVSGR